MATYSTNQEIRNSFPGIDNCLPVTKLNGAIASGGQTLTVDSTEVFPFAGTLYALDDANGLQSFAYTTKNRTQFFLTAVTTFNLSDNVEITTGDGALDHYRTLAKSWVDSIITNYNIPANFRKELEIQRVFYLAAMANYDPEKRRWAQQILESMNSFIETILRQYPPVIGRNIAYLPEDGLTDQDKDYLRNGPSDC